MKLTLGQVAETDWLEIYSVTTSLASTPCVVGYIRCVLQFHPIQPCSESQRHKCDFENELAQLDPAAQILLQQALINVSAVGRLKHMFYAIDIDGSGTISLEELRSAIDQKADVRTLLKFVVALMECYFYYSPILN